MKYSFKHILEYLQLRTAAGLVRMLPLRAALSLGWLIAAAAHFIGRAKVERTRRRIREVLGPDVPEKQIRHIAWISWRNLIFNAVDALRFSKLTPKAIRKLPLARSEATIKQALKDSENGVILAPAHAGNWEICGIAADLLGVPIFAIARRLKNPLLNDYINKMRSTFSMEIIDHSANNWKTVPDRLRQGKVLAILPDIRSKKKGVTVDFLGGKATIAPGTARFAQQADCPIYPVVARRHGWTQHEANMLAPIYPDPTADKTADQERMMKELMASLSAAILETPEQYFWYNKRWVLDAKK